MTAPPAKPKIFGHFLSSILVAEVLNYFLYVVHTETVRINLPGRAAPVHFYLCEQSLLGLQKAVDRH